MTRFSCLAGRHQAESRRVRNQGLEFGRCRACDQDLVRSRRAWRTVPRGFRVVWRRGPGIGAVPSAAQLLFDLPASGRALALRAAPKRAKRRIAVAVELVALGTRVLAWALADRVRAWARSLAAPRRRPQPMPRLPRLAQYTSNTGQVLGC